MLGAHRLKLERAGADISVADVRRCAFDCAGGYEARGGQVVAHQELEIRDGSMGRQEDKDVM